MRINIDGKRMAALFLFLLLLNGCTSLVLVSRKPRLVKVSGKQNIEVYLVATHRRIVWQVQQLSAYGHGTDTRIVSKMMTSSDKLAVYSSLLFIFPIFLIPSASDVPPIVDTELIFEKLQKELGSSVDVINKTKGYNSEKEFLRAKKKKVVYIWFTTPVI